MVQLQQFYSQKVLMWVWGIIGDILLLVGIVTTALNTTILGFTPMVWFLLAFACYVGMFSILAPRMLIHLEGQQ